MEREPSAVTAADFDGDGEIEVHFTKGDTDWRFEAELDDGLKVFGERDTQLAEDGRYSVGGAAEAKSSTNGGSLSPANLSTKNSWSVTTLETSQITGPAPN